MTFWSPPTKARCSPSYLPYRTWDPRPVAGSAGLVPTSWDAAQDQWGAIQMQNRFMKLNSRRMTALRHAGLDGGAHDRRSHIAHQFRRSESGVRLSQGAGFFRRGIQGPAADAARLEPAASPADPAGRRTHGRLGFAAGRFPASGLGTRHARRRPARNQMQAERDDGEIADVASLPAFRNGRVARGRGARFGLHRLCVEREEQHRIGHRHRQMDGHQDHQGRPAAARHRVHAGRQVRAGRGRRRRHHPGDRRRDPAGGGQPALRSRSGAVHPGCRRQDPLCRQRERQHGHRSSISKSASASATSRSASSPKAWRSARTARS